MAGFSLSTGLPGFAEARKRFANAVKTVKGRQAVAVQRAALLAEREIKKGLRKGKPGGKVLTPLAFATRLLRRGKRPLIDTGSLLGSIKTTMDKKRPAAFVGVHRGRKTASGESVVNVAQVHEFGTKPFVIPVTDKMRGLFAVLFRLSRGRIRPLSRSKQFIMHPGVPARPFIRPTIEAIRPELEAELLVAMREDRGPF